MAEARPREQVVRMSRRRALPRSDDKRPPLERLRTLVLEPGKERKARMMTRARNELDQTREPGPWIAAARTLHSEGVISENALYYLVEILLECITLHSMDHDPEMLRLAAGIDELKRAHGLRDDEEWYVDEGPPEWRALNDEWNERDRELRVQTLRSLGHDDLAVVLAGAPERFHDRESDGYFDVWGTDDDE